MVAREGTKAARRIKNIGDRVNAATHELNRLLGDTVMCRDCLADLESARRSLVAALAALGRAQDAQEEHG